MANNNMTHILWCHDLPLDGCAIMALRHVGAQAGPPVQDTIRSKVLPQWSKLDALAKEVIILHAMNTVGAVWDAVVGHGGEDRAEAFKLPLELLCEKHLNAQISDEDFAASANSTFDRIMKRIPRKA